MFYIAIHFGHGESDAAPWYLDRTGSYSPDLTCALVIAGREDALRTLNKLRNKIAGSEFRATMEPVVFKD